MLEKNSKLWNYLSEGQRGLIEEGLIILEQAKVQGDKLNDYSYVVFPFAKAYEGFLKQWFFDKGFIEQWQYASDHFRVGKVLCPLIATKLGDNSIYNKIKVYCENDPKLADRLWKAWRKGRNLVFHYFPHNLKALKLKEAEELIIEIIHVMNEAIDA